MDGVKLSTIKEEKDLGVLITDDLNPSVQCTEAARKAMSALRWSRRSFKYIDSNTFKVLYKTYIRPNIIEYGILHSSMEPLYGERYRSPRKGST